MSEKALVLPILKKPTPLQSMAMAGGAGLITVSFIHPVDVIKTWLQIQGESGSA